eukprot:1160928-Pelagomonas_calceolata.AAC.8
MLSKPWRAEFPGKRSRLWGYPGPAAQAAHALQAMTHPKREQRPHLVSCSLDPLPGTPPQGPVVPFLHYHLPQHPLSPPRLHSTLRSVLHPPPPRRYSAACTHPAASAAP